VKTVADQNKNYALGIVVRSQDLPSGWAKQAMTALRSEKYVKKFDDYL